MKIISKIKRYTWVLMAGPLMFTSCSEDSLDDINRDRNNPQNVEAKFILADVITRTAFSNSGGEINTYTSAYVEHEIGTHNQLFYAETRLNQPSLASTFNNPWGSLYETLKNAKLIIAKCSEGGEQEGNNITKGIGEVMAAYNLAILTDMYGDTPWSEAGDYNLTLNPKVDKQEEIYRDIMAYLDQAIIDLKGSDAHSTGSVGNYDLLYGGDADSWLRFAHGLKARYTMRLLKRSANANVDLQTVIDNVDLSFASADDEAAFAAYDATNLNPTFDFQYSRDGLAASRSITDKLIERNDPRLNRSFVTAYNNAGRVTQINNLTVGNAAYELTPENGQNEQIQYFYNQSIFTFSQTAPTLLLSYHEILFLKAEAMVRLGQANAAVVPVLKSAVVAAIANTERSVAAAANAPLVGSGVVLTSSAITTAEAGTYFDTNVLPLFTANALREVLNQKYISFFGASGESTEAYNDIRRLKGLGEDLIELQNSRPFPLRLPYGNDDTTTNPNVQAVYGDGQYVYSEPVWWAGGSR